MSRGTGCHVASPVSNVRCDPFVESSSGPYSAPAATASPDEGNTWTFSPAVLPELLSATWSQPFATKPRTLTFGFRVYRAIKPVNFTGRAFSNVNDVVGMRFSGSSSRSNPTGASNRPNDSVSVERRLGVQLIM